MIPVASAIVSPPDSADAIPVKLNDAPAFL
jgi:hypothetical protein